MKCGILQTQALKFSPYSREQHEIVNFERSTFEVPLVMEDDSKTNYSLNMTYLTSKALHLSQVTDDEVTSVLISVQPRCFADFVRLVYLYERINSPILTVCVRFHGGVKGQIWPNSVKWLQISCGLRTRVFNGYNESLDNLEKKNVPRKT